MFIDENHITEELLREYIIYSGTDENNEPYFELDFKRMKTDIIKQLARNLYEERELWN